jgi:hypothetical protein
VRFYFDNSHAWPPTRSGISMFSVLPPIGLEATFSLCFWSRLSILRRPEALGLQNSANVVWSGKHRNRRG